MNSTLGFGAVMAVEEEV